MLVYWIRLLSSLVLFISTTPVEASETYSIRRTTAQDNYDLTSPLHKSMLVAVGCFWCGEQAFEQYAPGIIEAVSGYAGADGIDNPTYQNHKGHYEVVLVEYDPSKSSYEVLLDYAWRNMDPFDGNGQFCDKGFAYEPAIFYGDDQERDIAERVKQNILQEYPSWLEADLKIRILERPRFWIAEEYHQDYYIKNPGSYGYYKNACGRSKRLKDVWGESVYQCYHDIDVGCESLENVTNADGTLVEAEVNRKGAEEPEASLLPQKYWIFIGASVGGVCLVFIGIYILRKKNGNYEK